MDIDPLVAEKLGFPKLRYVFVEHERRWLCGSVPHELVTYSDDITDVYVHGSNLRLREARPIAGGPPMLRLTRKVEVNPRLRLISSIYLQVQEFELLMAALSGGVIRKRRHRLQSGAGVVLAVDEFEGDHSGLCLLEAECESAEALDAFVAPVFAGAEVTVDPRFNGGNLAANGLPVVVHSGSAHGR